MDVFAHPRFSDFYQAHLAIQNALEKGADIEELIPLILQESQVQTVINNEGVPAERQDFEAACILTDLEDVVFQL